MKFVDYFSGIRKKRTHKEWHFLVGFRSEQFVKLLLQVTQKLLRRRAWWNSRKWCVGSGRWDNWFALNAYNNIQGKI